MPAAAYPQTPPTTPSTNKLKTNPTRVSRVVGIFATAEFTRSRAIRQGPFGRKLRLLVVGLFATRRPFVGHSAGRRAADCGVVRAQSLVDGLQGFLHDDEGFACGWRAHPRASRGPELHVEALPVRFKGLRAFAEGPGSRRYAFHGVREGIDAAR